MACGYEENADVNAAKNILTAGRAGLACEANHTGGRQQNPFRARASKPADIYDENLPLIM
jgi:transposase